MCVFVSINVCQLSTHVILGLRASLASDSIASFSVASSFCAAVVLVY